jgi:hypothetical protein
MFTTVKVGVAGLPASTLGVLDQKPTVYEIRALSWVKGEEATHCAMHYANTPDDVLRIGNYLAAWYTQRGLCFHVYDNKLFFYPVENRYGCANGNWNWYSECGYAPRFPCVSLCYQNG